MASPACSEQIYSAVCFFPCTIPCSFVPVPMRQLSLVSSLGIVIVTVIRVSESMPGWREPSIEVAREYGRYTKLKVLQGCLCWRFTFCSLLGPVCTLASSECVEPSATVIGPN
jgi:hypothetical protein